MSGIGTVLGVGWSKGIGEWGRPMRGGRRTRMADWRETRLRTKDSLDSFTS